MVTVANGERVTPIGETDITIEFEGSTFVTRVVIVDVLPEEFLIGLDFLHQNKIVVDFGGFEIFDHRNSDEMNSCLERKLLKNEKLNSLQFKDPVQMPIDSHEEEVKKENLNQKSNEKFIKLKNSSSNRSSLLFGDSINVFEELLMSIEKEDLRNVIEEFCDIFSNGKYDLGKCSVTKHKIETTSERPIKSNPYRVSKVERKLISDQVNDLLELGIVERTNSEWSSPVLLVKRKDGTLRFCVDFRRLNEITIKDCYPLPRIEDSLDALGGSHFFTTIDLTAGFWQVELDEYAKRKAAFVTSDGLFQFNVMPFGLCNAPSTFQRLMDHVLSDLKYSNVLVYMDDIVVFSKTFDEHISHLRKVFDRIRCANLKINPRKCSFARSEITFLGHIVSSKGIEPSKEKISSVENFQSPTTAKQVKQFLGLTGYYRRFIKNYAIIATPLNELLRT